MISAASAGEVGHDEGVTIERAVRELPEPGLVEPLLDHLVYAVPDLDAAARAFADATGVVPAPGGRHIGRGTRNMLVGLGPTAYLEIVGPDPEHPPDPGAVVPFGLDALSVPRLLTWAVHPADVDAAARTAAAAGADHGPAEPMSRRTPDGTLLEWRLACRHPGPLDGIAPFLIDWGATPHPAAAPELPATPLRGLRATHPRPPAVTAVLDALGLRLAVETGPPALTATIEGEHGPVVVT